MISSNELFSKFNKEATDILKTLSKSQKNLKPLWLSSLAINTFALALPLTMLQAYDRILPYHGVGTLQSLTIIMICVFVFEFILKYLRSYLTAWAGSVFEHNSTMESVDKIVHCDLEDYEIYGSKEIQNKFNEISKLRTFFSGQALTAVVDFPFSFIFLFIIYLIAKELVLVPLFFFFLIIFIAFFLGKKIRVEMKQRSINESKIYKHILESFTAIESIKTGGYENSFKKKYFSLTDQSVDSNYQTLFFNGLSFNLGFIFNQLMTMGVLAFGAYMIIEGNLGVGGLAACTILSGRIMQPVQKVLGLWTRFQGLNISFKNLQDINSLKQAVENESIGTPIIGNVEFKSVTIRYNETDMVSKMSLKFSPGDVVIFSSENSMVLNKICNSILGISKVDEGEILVDGANPFYATNSFHKEHISYLSANNSLFKGSVMENVTCFGSTDKETALESCKILGLSDLISTLPSGYSTKLENLGSDPISPGVKQKILLSRSLATEANIYIFDNADVGLDREGYNKLFQAIGEKSHYSTVFIFSDDENFKFLATKKVEVFEDGSWKQTSLKENFSEMRSFPKDVMESYEYYL